MKLIADCGSTKVDWALIDDNGHELKRIHTAGMNAAVMGKDELDKIIGTELSPELTGCKIACVNFYGAGIVSEATKQKMHNAISQYVDADAIEVESDLLAAARVLCGHEAGIACILGTGSNSCYYDGNVIVDNVSAGGYILGDEGSGAVLGRTLVSNVLKRRLPADLCTEFYNSYGLDMPEIIDRVYRRPGANRFLASLSPFLLNNIDRSEIRAIVVGAFKTFFEQNIRNYDVYGDFPVNFVGSIAYYYHDLLGEAAKSCGYRLGKTVKAPLDGLIQYHKSL